MIMNDTTIALIFIVAMALIFGFFTSIRASVSIKYEDDKPEPNPLKHPYRVSDNIDLYKDDKPADDIVTEPIKTESIKKEPFVMPKLIAVFLYLLPAMLTDIGLGMAYDTSLIGVGAKWGCLAAGIITNVFFIISAVARAEETVKEIKS